MASELDAGPTVQMILARRAWEVRFVRRWSLALKCEFNGLEKKTEDRWFNCG